MMAAEDTSEIADSALGNRQLQAHARRPYQSFQGAASARKEAV